MQNQKANGGDYEAIARQSFQWKKGVANPRSSKGQNSYNEIQAFNRKRTLAPQFFNQQNIVASNTKQFAPRMRGG